MIRPEDVADLRPGDVVEYSGHHDLEGAKVVGPLVASKVDPDSLNVGSYVVRLGKDRVPDSAWGDLTLTVVCRAPRPLYVNHDRTEPVPGDVVREEDPEGATVWLMDSFGTWQSKDSACQPAQMQEWPLRLLVDGATGQVVSS